MKRALNRVHALWLRVLYLVGFFAVYMGAVTYRGARALIGAAHRGVTYYPWDVTRWLRSFWRFSGEAKTGADVRNAIQRFNDAMGSPGAVEAMRRDPLPSPIIPIARGFSALGARIRRRYLTACRAAFVGNLAVRRGWRLCAAIAQVVRLSVRETKFHATLWWSWSRDAETADALKQYLTIYLRDEAKMSATGNLPLAEAIATYLGMTRPPNAPDAPPAAPAQAPTTAPVAATATLPYLAGADWADHRLN